MWGFVGGLLLFILLISPFISGLAHTRYNAWVTDRVIGLFVNLGDWEWKQLQLSVTNCKTSITGGN